MASKRKLSASSPYNQSHPQPPQDTAPFSSPEQPRRSTRHRRAILMKDILQPEITSHPRPSPGEIQRDVWGSPEAVDSAMKELRDMEERFQSAVRRERLAVEGSRLVGGPRDAEPEPFRRRPATRSRTGGFTLPRDVEDGFPKPALPEELETAPLKFEDAEDCANEMNIDADAQDDEVPWDPTAYAMSRPPAVHSDYLPLPWKGRLGYACLNTYLRTANPPVFSSRTCRIASILQHRHPLVDPSQPEHPVKNRPDETKPPDDNLAKRYLERLGLANARDAIKMIRWNDRFGIKFMRLSSEMFPFASHEEYGYPLAPFASEALREVGAVAAELDHRLTMHPGQFTQLGSPRPEVIQAAIRDLNYQDELLTLLRLPEQQDRDAVMVIHMGGTYGDKAEALNRFRQNYSNLSPSVKRRLVLENDDVGWTVHDLLPVCEELNIPLVLDFHHHNILFDANEMREGTLDIMKLFPRIRATWTRKGIRQKMHYSEPCAGAVTPRERRKHSARVKTLPPCPNDMDLMIESKDKEQAVFELMRAFRLPGHGLIADMVPYHREDEVRNPPGGRGKGKKKAARKPGKRKRDDDEDDEGEEEREGEAEKQAREAQEVPPEDFGMGGPLGRVYRPEGMESWLKPKKGLKRSKDTKIVHNDVV
ncbi:UV-damage endonuclease [Sodiomyces alkalinus F11]|uniref:UV-damage endonuclease n=1 Tax=Sodiomyces alkalinus (strain CBS 110278 / VKM F-3762 / F11) TaxID=1314773 RepID=A0A3N2PJ59_SODAK|nr:UV-damage endonuclease [Sodiomyces alkalinus F11]ROT34578.1 UV-damage endonuclease [Sodiomyces alkalinus F11]